MPDTNYIITPTGTFISESELYHYGVKGMRWGSRMRRFTGRVKRKRRLNSSHLHSNFRLANPISKRYQKSKVTKSKRKTSPAAKTASGKLKVTNIISRIGNKPLNSTPKYQPFDRKPTGNKRGNI